MKPDARLLPLLAFIFGLAACTRDFGVFEFDAADGGKTRSAAVTGEAGSDAATSWSDAAVRAPDSGHGRSDAAQAGDARTPVVETTADGGAVAPDLDAGGVADAGDVPVDASADAGPSGDDAAVTDGGSAPDDAAVSMCGATWTSASLPAAQCSTCACAECADPVLACLTGGTALGATQCRDVFACALEHDCKDWDCYCADERCGAPGASGDGPCVAQMDAAADGQRVQVMAVRQAGDPAEPLVRAMNAIGCVLGLDPHSPNGPLAGRCDATCP